MSKIKILHALQMVHIIAYKIYIWHKLLSQKEWIFKHLQNKVRHIYIQNIYDYPNLSFLLIFLHATTWIRNHDRITNTTALIPIEGKLAQRKREW